MEVIHRSKHDDLERKEDPPFITSRPILDEKLSTHRTLRLLMFCYVLFLCLTELLYVMPVLFENRWSMYVLVLLLGLYLFLGFVRGAVYCILKSPSIKGVFLADKLAEDWSYCVICETIRPPRTHHCHVCDTCVLRRDHHCTLLAQCIGQTNWHYFFSGLVFACLGSLLASWLNFNLVFNCSAFLPSSTWSNSFRIVCLISPPGFLWILRQVSIWQSVIFMLTSCTAVMAVMLLVLVFYYLRLIANNHTMSDRFPGPTRRQRDLNVSPQFLSPSVDSSLTDQLASSAAVLSYPSLKYGSLGWRQNMNQFLGDNWVKTVFFPFFSVDM